MCTKLLTHDSFISAHLRNVLQTEERLGKRQDIVTKVSNLINLLTLILSKTFYTKKIFSCKCKISMNFTAYLISYTGGFLNSVSMQTTGEPS